MKITFLEVSQLADKAVASINIPDVMSGATVRTNLRSTFTVAFKMGRRLGLVEASRMTPRELASLRGKIKDD